MRSENDVTEMSAPVISVIIASYNTRELLSQCLASIYSAPPDRPFEVLVMDDASKDGSGEMVRETFPQVRLVVNEENRGYAYSNNLAMAISRGRFVYLLNSDTEVSRDLVRGLVDVAETDARIGILGPKIYYHEPNNVIWSAGGTGVRK